MRRKKLKSIHELNQLLKVVYRSYVIYPNGTVLGNVVLDKDKRPKDKYAHGYFKSETILKEFPELVNTCLFSTHVYLAFRDDKPEELIIEDGNVMVRGEKATYKIGIVLNEDMLTMANNKLKLVGEEIAFVMENVDNMMRFTDEMVDKLVGYEKIIPTFNDSEEYPMHLTISEFPYLKKFKSCVVYMRDSHTKFFDVVYSTFNETEKFIMRRRFLKMKELEE